MLTASLRCEPAGLDVAVEVAAGECLAIAGPSGAGKTTLIRAIAGLAGATGRIECDGETWLDAETNLAPERRRCGVVFQDHALFGHMSALENVAYAKGDRVQARALLDRLGLGDRSGAKPRELSGGERQRVALARALARDPACLLLDEPLSSLDTRTRAHATRELAQVLREAPFPSLLVTHDFTEAALLGDRVAVLDAGRIVQTGTPAELAARPGTAFVADFTGAVVLQGTASAAGDHLTEVHLDGGGLLTSTDQATGPVAVTVFPWEISLEPGDAPPHAGSARNRLAATVTSVTDVGGRVRVGLQASQPLVAEVTAPAARELSLAPGGEVAATFKAAATRLVAR